MILAAAASLPILLPMSPMGTEDAAAAMGAAFCAIVRGDNLHSFPPAAVAVGPRVPTPSIPNEGKLLPAECTSAADAAADDVAAAGAAPAASSDDLRCAGCLFDSMLMFLLASCKNGACVKAYHEYGAVVSWWDEIIAETCKLC